MGENHFAPMPAAVYGFVLLMAAIAYYILQRAIIAQQGRDSLLASALGSDWKGKLSAVSLPRRHAAGVRESVDCQRLYVFVALMWLVPDRRIERALASHESRSEPSRRTCAQARAERTTARWLGAWSATCLPHPPWMSKCRRYAHPSNKVFPHRGPRVLRCDHEKRLTTETTKEQTMKKLQRIHQSSEMHWVGNGFPVRSVFDYNGLGRELSPFLLLDYAAPYPFPPGNEKRGVGAHPHKGFETVTVAYQGELEHRDSSGGGGKIGAGDVQWMTAGKGIVHEEFHSTEFTKQGGTLQMVQLWVNLRAKDKSAPPGYQTLLKDQIPNVALPQNAGVVRVIAGEYAGHKGPAKTFTPINLWDVNLRAGGDGGTAAAGWPHHGAARVERQGHAGRGTRGGRRRLGHLQPRRRMESR